jgi:hypothetical protein
MSNTPFSRLTVAQQADALLREGFFLDTRDEPGFFVDMYQLHGMYIEIYYHKEQENLVVVKSFYSSEDIQITCIADNDPFYSLPLNWREITYAC